jgi:acyl phosphate:glycerol-3-phosphate acyltransferase
VYDLFTHFFYNCFKELNLVKSVNIIFCFLTCKTIRKVQKGEVSVDIVFLLLAGLVGYAIGALSSTRLIVRIVAPKTDLSNVSVPVAGVAEPMHMSSVSANTAGLVLGPKVGGLIGILDILKVFFPTLAFRLLFPSQPYYLITALFAVAGHNWPIYYRFKGGRGISAIYGGLLAINWLGAILTSLGGIGISLFLLHDFAYIFPISLLLIIPWMWFTTYNPWFLGYGVAVNLLFILAIIPELKEVIRSRKEKRSAGTMQEMMETNPMGRSMLAIARRLKWMK